MKNLDQWLSRLQQQHPQSIELGLERVASVYARIGTGKPARQVITIAGTNGKGSTAAYVDAIARAAGWRCGKYTSPHLIEFNERIVVDDKQVNDPALCVVFEQIDAALNGTSLTYFEFTTLAALVLFSKAGLDLAILEVGLGGRLDAVNIIDPDVAVITSIGIDHQDWLGNDRELIGFEKAGIMRAGVTVICAERDPPESIAMHASTLSAPLRMIGLDYDRLDIMPMMTGAAQRDNFATAAAALRALPEPPGPLSDSMLAAAAAVTVPGRFQKLQTSPEIFVDVAHNVQAAEHLASCIERQDCRGRRWFILAMLADKQVEQVAVCLDGLAGQWCLAGLAGARGLSSQQLQERLAGKLKAPMSSHESVSAAIEEVLALACAQDQVLIFGSFVTVAEAIRYWNR